MSQIKTVKEMKNLINQIMLPNYQYKTNFSCSEFLIDIDGRLIIQAKPNV